MSQQATAEGLQQEGNSNEGELLGDVEALQAKHAAGEISGEAFDAELKALEDRGEENEKNFAEARRLNLMHGRAVSLSGQATQPQWSRPLADMGETAPDLLPEASAPSDETSSLSSGPMAPGGQARVLLNRYLRREKHGGGRRALTDEGWSYLTRRRTVQRNAMLVQNDEQLALNPFVDSSGGWLTAEEVSNEIVMLRDRASGLESVVRTIDIAGIRLAIPTMQVKVTFTKRSKATSAVETVIDMSKIIGRTSLTAHPKDATLKIPEQFFEEPEFDAVGAIAEAADRDSREDDETDILIGTGSGEPLGLVPTVTALFAAGATHIGQTPGGGGGVFTADEIKIFDTHLHANAMREAIYLINRVVLRQFRLYRSEDGGAGTGQYLFERATKAGEMDTFLERPVLTSEFLPDTVTSGSEGDVMWFLFNPRDYWLLRRRVLNLRVLEELFALEHMVGYMWEKSRDGVLVQADGILFARRGA